jgi:hypothetical protein
MTATPKANPEAPHLIHDGWWKVRYAGLPPLPRLQSAAGGWLSLEAGGAPEGLGRTLAHRRLTQNLRPGQTRLAYMYHM